jgi:probable F420-dependent oxidoreductase
MPLAHSPYPSGGDVPRHYLRTLDPFVALTAAAAATEKLLLGFGIALITQRDPIVTAKEVATLDHVSGGRVLFGVGAGWNIEEMRNHGTDPGTRFRRLRESVEAMKAIWTRDEAEYHGRIIDFDPIWCWPKPVQKPHPPVLVGGVGDKVLDRVVAYGDEWIPNRVKSPEALGERVAELQRSAEAAGRERIPVTVFGAKPEVRLLERLRTAGVTRSLFYLLPSEPAEVERQLDELTKVMREWAG